MIQPNSQMPFILPWAMCVFGEIDDHVCLAYVEGLLNVFIFSTDFPQGKSAYTGVMPFYSKGAFL